MSKDELRQMAVIGKKDAVLPFRTLGMLVSAVETKEEANKAVFEYVSKNIPPIYIGEDIFSLIDETVEKYKSDPKVTIIPIPSSSNLGLGMTMIQSNIKKAVGADLFLNTED